MQREHDALEQRAAPTHERASTSGACSPSRPKSIDMPTAMKNRPMQQALERLDVGLERVAILGAREQHAGEERAERHRHAGQRHQLRDADHQQQRERGEHLAQAGASRRSRSSGRVR